MLRLRLNEPFASNPLIGRPPIKPADLIAHQGAAARRQAQGQPGASPSFWTRTASQFGGSWFGRRGPDLDGSEHGGRLLAHRDDGIYAVIFQGITALSACVILTVSVSAVCAEPPTHGERPARSNSKTSSYNRWSTHIREAAKRFAIPERLLRAVMHVESAGDVHALSSKGAMGLMQIMPGTWKELRMKHHLGEDPYQPRDNILAGAGYLRELLDRFGRNGFLAAYNAGPGRYEEHLLTGRPLPRETIDYVRKLAPLIRGAVSISPHTRQGTNRASALEGAIFVQSSDIRNVVASHGDGDADVAAKTIFTAIRSPSMQSPVGVAVTDLTALEPQLDSLPFQAMFEPRSSNRSLFAQHFSETPR
ncbi:Transglycosylase SLT domain-containing protein [Mesorhizobium escarrei]|uniref:Transglycosylase SLT domain-containing protein n=1 Tax=Mesorhizobium escarrei TaxID=666018 RepID=A0ABM9EAV4_9HYPH|nr:Transglycosylase SLT domain-containing protein [Mesorhizobium escarrei]